MIRTPAQEARALVAQGSTAAFATLSDDGSPWCSLVQYAALDDGTPVLCVSTLAEHGRNLVRDPRASLMVAETDPVGDPLDSGRVTLAGRVEMAPGRGARRPTRIPTGTAASPTSRTTCCGSRACDGWAATAGWTRSALLALPRRAWAVRPSAFAS